jgi:hypothetical protein
MNYKRTKAKNARLRSEKVDWVSIVLLGAFLLMTVLTWLKFYNLFNN